MSCGTGLGRFFSDGGGGILVDVSDDHMRSRCR